MLLSSLLKSAAGTCPFCRQKAGIISRAHPGCRRTFQAGWNEKVRLARDAARSHEFHANSLQVALAEIARRSYGDASTVARALEEGWKQGVSHAMADGSITHEEEFRLRRFRDWLGQNRGSAHASATEQLNLTSSQRFTGLTQAVATTVEDGDRLLKRLSGRPGSGRRHSPYRSSASCGLVQREAAELQDPGQMVRIQPGCESGTDVKETNSTSTGKGRNPVPVEQGSACAPLWFKIN